MLFLTLVFSALSYPLGSMIVVVAATVTGVAVLGAVGGVSQPTARPRRRVRRDVPRLHGAHRHAVRLAGATGRAPARRAGRAVADRSAHRLPQPPRLRRAPGRRAAAGRRARAPRSRSCSSISTASRRSTTASATRPATSCCGGSAPRIHGLLRGSDATGRLGGDEFVLLLPRRARGRGACRGGRTVAALAERFGAPRASPAIPPTAATATSCSGSADSDLYAAKAIHRAAVVSAHEGSRCAPGRPARPRRTTARPTTCAGTRSRRSRCRHRRQQRAARRAGRPDVVFAYPRTGRPGEESPGGDAGWNAIPGARGCTPEACSFRDETDSFARAPRARVRALDAGHRVPARGGRAPAPAVSAALGCRRCG